MRESNCTYCRTVGAWGNRGVTTLLCQRGGIGGGADYAHYGPSYFYLPPNPHHQNVQTFLRPCDIVQWSLRSLETIQPHDRDNYTPVQCTKSTKCGKNYYEGPIPQIFRKKKRIGGFENHRFFQSAILKLFFHIKIEAKMGRNKGILL